MVDKQLELQGFKLWDNHPGYTIEHLNKMLAPHGLEIETKKDGNLWFKVVNLDPLPKLYTKQTECIGEWSRNIDVEFSWDELDDIFPPGDGSLVSQLAAIIRGRDPKAKIEKPETRENE